MKMVNARMLFAACSLAVCSFACAPALAQPGGGGGGPGGGGGGGMRMMGGGMRDMMGEAPIGENQLEKYGTIVGMTKEQNEAVALLHEGYMAEVRAAQDEVRSQMEAARDAFRESGDPTEFQKVRASAMEARTKRRQMDQTFLNDVKALLTEEQAAKWPNVEMAMRRDQSLRRGLMSGERVNLFQLVDDLKLGEDARKPIDELLGQYEVDLDRELIKRNAVSDKAIEQMDQLREDPAKAQAMLEEGRTAGTRVRDVNRRYARQISEALPAEMKAGFDAAFQRESFPSVYRESSVTRGVTAAMGFEDLTEEQRGKIQALNEKYARDAASVNERLAKAQEENEMTMTADRMFQRGPGGGGEEESPLQTLRQERRDLDRKANEALREILTETQREKLPSNDMRGRRDGGGDQGGDGQRPRRGGGQGGGQGGGDGGEDRSL